MPLNKDVRLVFARARWQSSGNLYWTYAMTAKPTITVQRIDPKTDLFMYSETIIADASGNFHIPGNCVQVETPAGQEGKCFKWQSTVARTNYQFGKPGTGIWSVLDDYRKTDVYTTNDGSKYALDSEHTIVDQVVSFVGYGELPEWLTTTVRPSHFHNWDGADWAPDQAAIDEHAAEMERAWRDSEIARIEWQRDRHRDEIEQELPTTLTEAQYTELQAYIQALRDWPAHPEVPEAEARPLVPAWLAVPA